MASYWRKGTTLSEACRKVGISEANGEQIYAHVAWIESVKYLEADGVPTD